MVKTLRFISDETKTKRENLHEVSCEKVKRSISYAYANNDDLWRISLGQELMSSRGQKTTIIPGFTDIEIKEILDFVCTS